MSQSFKRCCANCISYDAAERCCDNAVSFVDEATGQRRRRVPDDDVCHEHETCPPTLADLIALGKAHGLVSERNGESCWHAALFVLVAARTAYAPDSDTQQQQRGMASLDCLLSVARAQGFAKGDILRTLLARGEYSERTVSMARDAMSGASTEALAAALARTGFWEK